jgi:hypothetical protein
MQMQCKITGIEALEQMSQEFPNVVFRSLKKTAEQMRTQAKRSITARYNIPSSIIKDDIKISASLSKLAVRLKLKSSRLPIALFNPKFSRGIRSIDKTIYVTILRGQQKPIKSVPAFVTGVETGHKGTKHFGIFARTGKARLPIKELTTLSPSDMFGSHSVWGKLEEFFYKKFPEILDHEMKFEMTKNK